MASRLVISCPGRRGTEGGSNCGTGFARVSVSPFGHGATELFHARYPRIALRAAWLRGGTAEVARMDCCLCSRKHTASTSRNTDRAASSLKVVSSLSCVGMDPFHTLSPTHQPNSMNCTFNSLVHSFSGGAPEALMADSRPWVVSSFNTRVLLNWRRARPALVRQPQRRCSFNIPAHYRCTLQMESSNTRGLGLQSEHIPRSYLSC